MPNQGLSIQTPVTRTSASGGVGGGGGQLVARLVGLDGGNAVVCFSGGTVGWKIPVILDHYTSASMPVGGNGVPTSTTGGTNPCLRIPVAAALLYLKVEVDSASERLNAASILRTTGALPTNTRTEGYKLLATITVAGDGSPVVTPEVSRVAASRILPVTPTPNRHLSVCTNS